MDVPITKALAKVEVIVHRLMAEALKALGLNATTTQVDVGSWLLMASIAYLIIFYLLPSKVVRRLIGFAILWAWLLWALNLIPGL